MNSDVTGTLHTSLCHACLPVMWAVSSHLVWGHAPLQSEPTVELVADSSPALFTAVASELSVWKHLSPPEPLPFHSLCPWDCNSFLCTQTILPSEILQPVLTMLAFPLLSLTNSKTTPPPHQAFCIVYLRLHKTPPQNLVAENNNNLSAHMRQYELVLPSRLPLEGCLGASRCVTH